jgi:hypothetical protein
MKWLIRFFALALFNTFFVAPVICHLYARERLTKLRQSESELRELVPKFVADLRLLQTEAPFPDWRRTQNAEPFLSQWISWEGAGAEKLDTPSHRALRELFTKYPRAMKDPLEFRKFSVDPLLDRVETRWFPKIADYDHWRPSANARVIAHIAEASTSNSLARVGIFAQLPVPDFTELRRFAFAHFVKMHNQKRATEGLSLFRKAAELMHTSGSLIGGMSAAAMLGAEPLLADFAHEYAWPAVPRETVERYRRVSWTWTGYVNGAWLSDFPGDLQYFLKPQTGICNGAGENIAALTAFSDFFEENAPFEINFQKTLARSREFQRKIRELCGQPEYSTFLERTIASSNPFIMKDAPSIYQALNANVPPLILNPSRLPYVRRVVGLTLMTIAAPDYLRFYRSEGH